MARRNQTGSYLMTHHEFTHIVESLNGLSPDQLQQLRDELDGKLTGLKSPSAIENGEATPAYTGKPIWEEIDEITAAVPDEEFLKLPADGAAQHDHYIYGLPKRPTS
jgi:hypothetical protein